MGLGAPDLAGASVQQYSELGGVWEDKDGYHKASATYLSINSIYIHHLRLQPLQATIFICQWQSCHIFYTTSGVDFVAIIHPARKRQVPGPDQCLFCAGKALRLPRPKRLRGLCMWAVHFAITHVHLKMFKANDSKKKNFREGFQHNMHGFRN